MSTSSAVEGRARGARSVAAHGVLCACALASAACSGDVVRANGVRSALGGSLDAAVTDPPLLAGPGQEASWTNLWGSWPLTRTQHAAAYDSDRKILVVYGGQGQPSGSPLLYYNDTWEWDGARLAWTQRTNLGSNAFTRSGHAMAYDPVAKKTFMFSGWQPANSQVIPGQWEWDGVASTWTERRISTTQPDARHDHAMVYIPDRQRIVLFGGLDGTQTRRNDIWEWNGAGNGSWEDCTPAGTRPLARYGHSLAYDSVRKRVVMRGGTTTGSTWVNETWEWTPGTGAACSSGSWMQLVTTGTAPPYSASVGFDKIVFDQARGKTVLFEYGPTNTVYELDPATPTWTAVTTTGATPSDYPPAQYSTLTYDSTKSRILAFSGTYSPRELWEYDGSMSLWKNRSIPLDGPIQRQGPALAFDTKRSQLILFGGYTPADAMSTYKSDVQQWSGVDQNWQPRVNFDTQPNPRWQSAMAYDSKRDQMWLFGGLGTATYDDLWTWNPTAGTWTQVTINGVRPTARYAHSMFYDASRDRLVVFGGSGTQIWELNLATQAWTNRSPTTIPQEVSSRSYADVAFDSDRGKVMLVGGYSSTSAGTTYNTDIWEWDVSTDAWTAAPPVAGSAVPVGRYYHSIAYDSGRRVLVMIGGHANVTGNTAQLNDSWEWDPATSTWTDTTPATAVKPLPRESHTLVYDSTHGTTFLFGGTVTGDSTYGPQEIWEYAPNSAPRANGAACSSTTASRCASGFCVDGVCCSTASCPGTCQACNVDGPAKGTCANVAAGTPDDTCAADQACDAAQKCKSRNGLACASFADCATGHCADGVCCESDCSDTCKACNLTGKRGVCTNIGVGVEDPVAAPACVSDAAQGRSCDGNGVCTNLPRPVGSACTASGQCNGGRCIDGVCCNSTCTNACFACNVPGVVGTCSPLPPGQQDHSATVTCDATNQYCVSGSCQMNKKPNGGSCSVAADCGSTFCVDGVCCNSACLGTCQACNVTGKAGSCVNLPAGATDNTATVTCALPQYCDALGTCQSGLKANGISCTTGAQCGSSNCVDSFCCDSPCAGTCQACNVANNEGTCTAVTPGGTDPTATPACTTPNYCVNGTCTVGRKPNGATCVLGNECGSNNCVDGTCCENSCTGNCLTCKNSTGSCVLAAAGSDIRKSCGSGDCAGTCDGQGGCNYPASGKVCGTAGCASDGVIHQPGTCDGAGKCANDVLQSCNGFKCYHDPADNMDKCATSCATDPNCQVAYFCNNLASCPIDFDNGHACDRDAQCSSNHCAIAPGDTTGVCCDRDCRACGTCNLPGKVGTCVPTEAGTDPNHDCIDSASDPSGKCGGRCNGQWACEFPAAGTSCGTCKQCDGASKCSVKPDDDDICGVIDCDQLDTSCMDYRDLQRNRCASLGVCKAPNTPAACTDVLVTCTPDAGGGGDAMSMPDGMTGADGAGSDATLTPPKGGGGGCGCEVGTRDGRGELSTLAGLFLAAGLIAGGRRRRRPRRG